MAISGVGKETCSVILVYALYYPMIIVDADTRRFLSRLGFVFHLDDEIRGYFSSSLPLDTSTAGALHWLLLEHSIAQCKKKPECDGCTFFSVCQRKTQE